ncbi:MAG: ACT domain-containing protein [Actinomycetota bacterium]|nr:ACT domain-containing protein [Actinomycetota bacterium]
MKLEGLFDLELIGILVSVAAPLAEAGVSVFAIATYDTDYVLVRESQLDLARSVLSERGHVVRR